MTRKERWEAILKAVSEGIELKTIDEIRWYLEDEYDYTPSKETIQKDLVKLDLVKIDGVYQQSQYQISRSELYRDVQALFQGFVKDVKRWEAIVVIQCLPGFAGAIAERFYAIQVDDTYEKSNLDGILGSLHNHWYVWVLCESVSKAQHLSVKLKTYI